MTDTEFKREERYIVLKKSHLTNDQLDHLSRVIAISDMTKSLTHCVVIEHDWPEYETVFQMLESRVLNDTETEGREDCPIIEAHCDYYSYQYDRNDELVLSHSDNKSEYEGNCTHTLCPLTKPSQEYS